jgi:glyoxylase I family protein
VLVLQSLHHVSISVTDLARARRFYGEVLGLPEIPRPHFDVNGAWYQAGDHQIHLIVYEHTTTLRGSSSIQPRDGHFALRVERYEDTVRHLRAHGVECLELPDNTTPWAQVYITDPDGNIIELTADREH